VTEIPVCIFAKPPRAGHVKTRLARFIGFCEAAALASAMLRDTWSVVQSVPNVVPVLAATEPGSFGIDVPGERIWLQPPGDLGSRMEGILRRGLQTRPAAIALGADSPLLTPAHVREALQHLEREDAVMGPCADGGFYLLGVRNCPSGLLTDLPWSRAETYRETERRLHSYGMTVGRTVNLFDVDTVVELEQLRSELEHLPPQIAPETRQWFAEISW
jgi:uncharacterized protein